MTGVRPSPRQVRICIREALGQLLEYACWPGGQEAMALIAVGEPALDSDAEVYLRELRSRFSVPIYYQQFDMKTRCLVGTGPDANW